MHKLFVGKHPFYGNLYGNVTQAAAESGFADFGLTAEYEEAKRAKSFGSETQSGGDGLRFPFAAWAAGDAEYRDGRRNVGNR